MLKNFVIKNPIKSKILIWVLIGVPICIIFSIIFTYAKVPSPYDTVFFILLGIAFGFVTDIIIFKICNSEKE
jgi:hypothetical protein